MILIILLVEVLFRYIA